MPGSIHVSVLGLMDLSSPPPLSSLFLTVAMGKREYQTVGGGELSLPVVSLRENLVVMVHDAEGEEILRTEFRTMLLLERGLWDNLFLLKNGGSLHLKLQFLLSEEDRKRIREMRDSALKKRHMDKPRTSHRRSFSDNRIGYLPTRTITEIATEGMILDNSEPADPIVEPYFGQSDKFPASRIGVGGFARSAVIGEGDASNLSVCETMSKSFSAGMLSEISSKGKSKQVEKSFFPKKEMQNAISAMHFETPGNKDLKCDEKIHKLDIGAKEIKETKNKSSDAATPYSSKSGSSVTIDNIPITIGSGKSTRLAAETSSERKYLTVVDFENRPSIVPLIRNFETVREKENLNLMQKGGNGLGSNAAFGTFKARPSSQSSTELRTASADHSRDGKKHNTINMSRDGNLTSFKGVTRKINIVDVEKNNNEERSLRDKSLPLKEMLNDLEKIDHPCQQRSLGEVARTVSNKNMQQSPSNEQTVNSEHSTAATMRKSRNWSGHGDAASSEGVNRTEILDVNENNNKEQYLGDNSFPLKKMVDELEKIKHPYHLGTSVEVAKTVNDENNLQSPSTPGSSYEKAEALKFCYSLECPMGILGSWTPRHLCITTGSKMLREFAESCTASSKTNSIASSFMRDADAKRDGDACDQGNENRIFPSSESSIENSSSLESSGGFD